MSGGNGLTGGKGGIVWRRVNLGKVNTGGAGPGTTMGEEAPGVLGLTPEEARVLINSPGKISGVSKERRVGQTGTIKGEGLIAYRQ